MSGSPAQDICNQHAHIPGVAIKFQETQDYIPELPARIFMLAMAATLVFMIGISAAGIIDGWWQVGIFAIVTAVCVFFCMFVKIRIVVDDENLTVSIFKPYVVPLAHVIDVKKGDIDITRNYSGWGVKKVRFRNYTAHGIEGAVSVKLAGRIVLTMTCRDRDTLYDILYQYRRQD